jgi:hypothetical protein
VYLKRVAPRSVKPRDQYDFCARLDTKQSVGYSRKYFDPCVGSAFVALARRCVAIRQIGVYDSNRRKYAGSFSHFHDSPLYIRVVVYIFGDLVFSIDLYRQEQVMIKSRRALRLFLCFVLFGPVSAQAQTDKNGNPFDSVRFLIGDWVGEGSSKAGQGQGAFSIKEDLGGAVLVRRDHTDYPAANGKPAFSLDVMMVIYAEGGQLRATYFDNEKHAIHYTAQSVVPGTSIQFVSGQLPGAPTFRLTYTKTGGDKMSVKFELAPPGKPDSFATYAEGEARRKGSV